MKVFIFGAGASQGSQHNNVETKRRSPLVDELFNIEYQSYYTDLFQNPEELEEYRNDLGNNIQLEKYLTDWWSRIGKLKNDRTKQAEKKSLGKLVFYLWWLFQNVSDSYSGINYYAKLLKKIRKKDEDVGFISFNYDTLFDRAYSDIYGAKVYGEINNYLGDRLIKPHGSVNWLLPKRASDPGFSGEGRFDSYSRYSLASSHFFNGPPLLFNDVTLVSPDHIDLKSIDFISNGRFGHQYFLPLIFIPLSVKMYSFVAQFYEKIIIAGINLLSEADEITVIGYRANDEVIKDLVVKVKSGTIVNVVSKNNPNKIMERIIKLQPNLQSGTGLNQGFAKYVDDY